MLSYLLGLISNSVIWYFDILCYTMIYYDIICCTMIYSDILWYILCVVRLWVRDYCDQIFCALTLVYIYIYITIYLISSYICLYYIMLIFITNNFIYPTTHRVIELFVLHFISFYFCVTLHYIKHYITLFYFY